MWLFEKSLLKNWKKFNPYVLYLWWNDVRMSKIIADKFGNSLILMYSICDEMMRGFQKSLSKTFEKF